MRRALRLHPTSICAAVSGIEVQATRHDARHLTLQYRLSGRTNDVRFSSASQPLRADKLWQTTCFEAFLSTAPEKAYCEFNFAPSTEWAAYRFDTYRSNCREIGGMKPPRIETSSDKASYRMEVSLDLDGVPGLPACPIWHVGLAAVIEETSGQMSYWALTHPPGKADFHHADGFALELRSGEES